MSSSTRYPVLDILALAVLWPAAGGAQQAAPKLGERIGDWTFQCQALTAKQTTCALVQAIINNKTRRQVLAATLRSFGKDGKLGLIVNLPLGFFLGAGVVGKVDDGERLKFILQSCNQRGCQAAVDVSGSLKAAIKSGKRLLVAFKPRAEG